MFNMFLKAIASSIVSLTNFQVGYLPGPPHDSDEKSNYYSSNDGKGLMHRAHVSARFAHLETLIVVAMQASKDPIQPPLLNTSVSSYQAWRDSWLWSCALTASLALA